MTVPTSVALPTAGIGERRILQPLQRKPKRLGSAPDLFATNTNGAPVVVTIDAERGTGEHGTALPVGGQGVLVTAQIAAHRQLSELLEDTVPNPEAATMAQAILRRLAVRRRPRDARTERGTGWLTSVPYSHRSDDIDLDRTIEKLVERPLLRDSDVIVRDRTSSRRAAVLIIDVSGSMRGEKVLIAAAAVAALSADLSATNDQLALVAFWSDAAVVKTLAESATPVQLMDTLLRIPARGLTNVGFGLSVAHAELSRASTRRTAILLTDAVHNCGPDPREVARRFPHLHVLLETSGEHDLPLGRDIARLGHGTLTRIATHRDIAPAINRILNR